MVASRLDALDARCTEMKSMMQKLVENQPTKTCLDAVKAAREAAARSEAAARQAAKTRGGVASFTARKEEVVI